MLLLLACVPCALLADAMRSRAHEGWRSTRRYEDVYYLPSARWLPVLSLGHREALADLLWIRALVYFGDELTNRGAQRHLFEYADAIVELDPRFPAVYRWMGMAAFYGALGTRPEDGWRAIELMERGASLFPGDGDLAWDLGAALAFEMPVVLRDRAEIDRARERAAPHLMAAVRLGSAPEWAALSNASMLVDLGRTEQAARHLEEMYAAVRDPTVRDEIAARIEELRTRGYADAVVTLAREQEERRRRDFPYVSSEMHLLLGERPPVDISAPIRDGLASTLAGAVER